MCVWECVIEVININKYKQNCVDAKPECNIKVETELDIHSNVKQAVKWRFRHVTDYNTNKQNTINVSVFRTLGGPHVKSRFL